MVGFSGLRWEVEDYWVMDLERFMIEDSMFGRGGV
jgi:hypothetical protein